MLPRNSDHDLAIHSAGKFFIYEYYELLFCLFFLCKLFEAALTLLKIYTCLMLILLSKCVACFLWLYDHKVHSLAVAFKQLSSGLAGKVKNKFIFIKYTT